MIIALGFITICNLKALSQPESVIVKGKETFLMKDRFLKVKSFTSNYVNGTTSLSWIVSDQKCKGTFIIYRSTDGENFEIIGLEESVLVSKKTDNEYFFNDNEPITSGQFYYKIFYLGVNNCCYTSNVITVKKT